MTGAEQGSGEGGQQCSRGTKVPDQSGHYRLLFLLE